MAEHNFADRRAEREWVSIDEMIRDPEINPGIVDQRRAEFYAANFDPDLVNVVTLSRRTNGKCAIIDGQNRVEALRILGWNGQKMEADVFRGLTKAEEAKIFLGLANTRNHGHADRFIARITKGDPVAVAIKKCVEAAGYVIDRAGRDGVISATKALEDVYLGRGQKVRSHNPGALDNTILVITAAWGRTRKAVTGQVIQGIGGFFLRYESAIDRERVVRALRGVVGGPVGLIQRGKGKQELHGGTVAYGIGHFITDQYNKGLASRSRKRLPNWRGDDDEA